MKATVSSVTSSNTTASLVSRQRAAVRTASASFWLTSVVFFVCGALLMAYWLHT